MPGPVTQQQTVQAVNDVLATMQPVVQIQNLDTTAMSDPGWSCNEFAPDVLLTLCKITGLPQGESKSYARGATLPASFPGQTFVNISMLGEPSALNHNVNILVSDGTTYLIQAFVGQTVPIVQRFANADFISNWHNLSNDVNWQAAYSTLFGIAPGTVVPDPPRDTWLTSQWVTY